MSNLVNPRYDDEFIEVPDVIRLLPPVQLPANHGLETTFCAPILIRGFELKGAVVHDQVGQPMLDARICVGSRKPIPKCIEGLHLDMITPSREVAASVV